MAKKGISGVVATVLMILIAAVAVAVVYSVILPLFTGISEMEFSNLDLGVSLDGFTVYDTDTGYVFVQIKRGNDDLNLVGLKIILEVGGVSDDSTTYLISEEDVLGPNQKKTYVFDTGSIGIPEGVSVVPLLGVGEKKVEGSISSRVLIPKNNLGLTNVEREKAHQKSLKYSPIYHLQIYYYDRDGDGYGGDVEGSFEIGKQDPGYVLNSGDCNDDPSNGNSQSPGLEEVPDNNLDENCDGWYGVSQDQGGNPGFNDFQSWRNYYLMGDLDICQGAGVCYVISNSNLVLDLNGHLAVGNIELYGNNITLLNGTIDGLTITGSEEVIKNISTNPNERGFFRLSGSGNSLFENIIIPQGSDNSIYIVSGSNNIFRNVTSCDAGNAGFNVLNFKCDTLSSQNFEEVYYRTSDGCTGLYPNGNNGCQS